MQVVNYTDWPALKTPKICRRAMWFRNRHVCSIPFIDGVSRLNMTGLPSPRDGRKIIRNRRRAASKKDVLHA